MSIFNISVGKRINILSDINYIVYYNVHMNDLEGIQHMNTINCFHQELHNFLFPNELNVSAKFVLLYKTS